MPDRYLRLPLVPSVPLVAPWLPFTRGTGVPAKNWYVDVLTCDFALALVETEPITRNDDKDDFTSATFTTTVVPWTTTIFDWRAVSKPLQVTATV